MAHQAKKDKKVTEIVREKKQRQMWKSVKKHGVFYLTLVMLFVGSLVGGFAIGVYFNMPQLVAVGMSILIAVPVTYNHILER